MTLATKPKGKPRSQPKVRQEGTAQYELRLYVAGSTPKSLAAISNLREICEEHIAGRYKVSVIDLIQKPHLARGDQILAVPTLVRGLPVPMKKIIGDLSDTGRVLVGLDIKPIRPV